MTAPDWLAARGGSFKLASDKKTWYVVIDQRPQFGLVAVPVQGRFGCHIKRTVSGQRIDFAGVFPTAEEALRAGLEEVRKTLGW